MNFSKKIDDMDKFVDALDCYDPERARNYRENRINPAKSLTPCEMRAGDRPVLEKMAPKTGFNEKSLITRYLPGEVYAAVQNPEHVNLLEVKTPVLKNEAVVSLNFNLGAHAEYAVNAATVDAIAKPSDVFVLAKTGLLMADEIETLQSALPRFRGLNPSGELPLIYLHVAGDTSPEEAKVQFATNMEVLDRIPGGVTKAFECDSLDDDDVNYQAYREFWRDFSVMQRELFLQPLCDSFIEEVTAYRDVLRLREKALSEEYQNLAHVDETAYQKLVDALEQMTRGDRFLAPKRQWEDFIETKKHQVSLEFIDNGNGQPTVHEVALEDLDAAPTGADSAAWDRYRVEKSIAIKDAYAGLIQSVCVDLEAQYTDLRINACEDISDLLKKTAIELPKALEDEIMRRIAEVEMRQLSPTHLMTTADKVFRYTISTSFCSSIGISTAAAIAYVIAALKGGGEAAAAASPLGPPVIIIAGVIGAIAGLTMADMLIKSQDEKAFRNEWVSKTNQFLRVLSAQAQFAIRELGTQYGRLLTDDLTAIHKSVKDVVESYQEMSPEDRKALIQQMRAAITTLDDVLESGENDDSENGDSENDNNVRD